ncbi:MAG: precorrin-4 C(11)-methyltransferase, partial [Parabacteroides sp.]
SNAAIAAFVNQGPTALLLDIRDQGTDYLERTAPAHVKIYYRFEEIPQADYALLIAVTPYRYETTINTLTYIPKVLHVGLGCRKGMQGDPVAFQTQIEETFHAHHLHTEAIADLNSIDLKKEEPMLNALATEVLHRPFQTFSAEELKTIEVPNPSAKVEAVTDSPSVSEASAIYAAQGGPLLIDKQKGALGKGNEYTLAVALGREAARQGHIEIVGAGPGDPELISIRGRQMLERADLILYAGSLVPKALTTCAKAGAMVRSSADLDLEQQFALMKEYYDKGGFIVRLHTGDPCIYGAIQEQMNYFDQYGMDYHITPGISSFQAAAAALRSQFTIPEKVQTIILTRGEGRTPMPEKEQLHKLAQSQSTMCIYLSAGIVEQVQTELLQAYPPTTPVAACYKLTWKEERIYRGELKDLAKIVKENHLTLTTLLVVGDAIDNRKGLSRLYAHEFKHLFRK